MSTPSTAVVGEPARDVPVVEEADVVVCGAGPAGIAAAITAARAGARTRLLEVHGCLGGVWTAGQLAWLFEMHQPGLCQEIGRELERRGARRHAHPSTYAYDIEAMKLLLEELCAAAGVRFQLFTRVVAAAKSGDRLAAVVTESKSGRQAWKARGFVDASGDGDLGALAGCGFDVGRPGTGQCQPMTFMALLAVRDPAALSRFISFSGGEVDWPGHTAAWSAFLAELQRAGAEPSYHHPTLFHVGGNVLALMVNHEYGVSALDAGEITAATVRARAEVHRVVEALGKLGGGWEGVHLVATAEQIGVREGRRLHGRYAVNEADLRAGARHGDAVCRVSFGVDVHNTDPATGKGQEAQPFQTRPYDLPFRALQAEGVDNLLFAGRCLSGDFLAHSSYRVTGIAVATGQAAGAGAALGTAAAWPEVAETLVRTVGWLPPDGP